MDLNTILTELVVVANKLDGCALKDVAADVDAAIFILSSEEAQPLNRSLASLSREQYAFLKEQDISDTTLENLAVDAAQDVSDLTNKILVLEPKLMVAVLQSLVKSMQAILSPGSVLSASTMEEGTELLAEAERKLAEGGFGQLGYRVGLIRDKIEHG